ncbi:glycoside hydrolase family 2 protein [Sesbania bispinosa]|nr:glycoside hydrolase family 2 protein [Sesbania bispinosa]
MKQSRPPKFMAQSHRVHWRGKRGRAKGLSQPTRRGKKRATVQWQTVRVEAVVAVLMAATGLTCNDHRGHGWPWLERDNTHSGRVGSEARLIEPECDTVVSRWMRGLMILSSPARFQKSPWCPRTPVSSRSV